MPKIMAIYKIRHTVSVPLGLEEKVCGMHLCQYDEKVSLQIDRIGWKKEISYGWGADKCAIINITLFGFSFRGIGNAVKVKQYLYIGGVG